MEVRFDKKLNAAIKNNQKICGTDTALQRALKVDIKGNLQGKLLEECFIL